MKPVRLTSFSLHVSKDGVQGGLSATRGRHTQRVSGGFLLTHLVHNSY